MFDAIQLIIQMCTSLLRWRLNQALQVSQGSASTCFRWSGHFRQNFVKGLFRDTHSNFYWNRFIFDRQGAKNKLAQFFLRHGVDWRRGLCCSSPWCGFSFRCVHKRTAGTQSERPD